MFPSLTPQSSCESIVQFVRSSPLNFKIRETPFSIFLTIRKGFNKNLNVQAAAQHPLNYQFQHSRNTDEVATQIKALETENHSLKVRQKYFEQSNDILAKQLEKEVEGAENQASELKVTIENLSKLQTSFDKLEVAQTNLRKERSNLKLHI